MRAARARGKKIGLVNTAEIHDALPAAFAAHARSRRDTQSIVDQLLALEPDVLIGGGRAYFIPKGQRGGRRDDGKDILAAFAAKGYEAGSRVYAFPAADIGNCVRQTRLIPLCTKLNLNGGLGFAGLHPF